MNIEYIAPFVIVALVLSATWFWLWRKPRKEDVVDVSDVFKLPVWNGELDHTENSERLKFLRSFREKYAKKENKDLTDMFEVTK